MKNTLRKNPPSPTLPLPSLVPSGALQPYQSRPGKMAPVIWGLDLREMQWWKFKGSYMFNRDYHLRRSKMIVYQIAMILCVCSESVGTAALSG